MFLPYSISIANFQVPELIGGRVYAGVLQIEYLALNFVSPETPDFGSTSIKSAFTPKSSVFRNYGTFLTVIFKSS